MSKILRPLAWILGLLVLVVGMFAGLLAAGEQVELNRYSMSNRCSILLDQYDQCMLDNGYIADDRRFPDYTRRFLGNFAHAIHLSTDGPLGVDDERYRQGPMTSKPRKAAAKASSAPNAPPPALPPSEASRGGASVPMPGPGK
jgi:hypothetical protein